MEVAVMGAETEATGAVDLERRGFVKNMNEELRIERRAYQGHDLIHCRVWERVEGGWRPTPRGLSLSPELWEAIMPEIVELARGALDGGSHDGGR